jgi:hypothetical protein
MRPLPGSSYADVVQKKQRSPVVTFWVGLIFLVLAVIGLLTLASFILDP